MAGGLYTTFCEVTGRVHWSMMYHMSSGNILTPGKLLLLKLSTNFYMQCILESGKKSEVVKVLNMFKNSNTALYTFALLSRFVLKARRFVFLLPSFHAKAYF